MDLEKFFDRVNHDVLMSRVARRIKDKRVLLLVRAFLEAGIMFEGLVQAHGEGTPQGGPLSPLLSNILLDDLDKELERRGHRFCRYADDCNIYVKSKAAGERVMDSLIGFLGVRLKLKAAPVAVKRLKSKLREIFRRGRGRNLRRVIAELNEASLGWVSYFRLAQVKGVSYERQREPRLAPQAGPCQPALHASALRLIL